MRGGSIAKRYAVALLGVAQEKDQIGEVGEDLEQVLLLIEANPALKGTLESPVIKPTEKRALWEKIQARVQVGSAVENLLRILIDQSRMALLPMLARIYRDLADEAMGQVRVQVKAATDLGESREALTQILEKTLGKKVILEVHVEPGLLGGLAVQVQDQVYDATLKRELERLKAQVIEQAVA